MINSCELKSSEFNTIIKTAHNIEQVWIMYSKISKDQMFNFAIKEPYKTKFLYLSGTGNKEYNDWSANPDQFKDILVAISKSGLK